MGTPVTCGPRGFPYGHHSLYRNKGDGTFADVSAASGIAASKNSYGLTAIAGDFDDDGWPDIYLACDSTPSLLFMNNRDGTFREEGAIRGVAYGEDGQEQAGMGVAVGDYDLDGRIDIFKTNFEGDTPDLYHNLGNANFEEASPALGWRWRIASYAGARVWPILITMASPICLWWRDTLFQRSESAIPTFPQEIQGCCFATWETDDSRNSRIRRER